MANAVVVGVAMQAWRMARPICVGRCDGDEKHRQGFRLASRLECEGRAQMSGPGFEFWVQDRRRFLKDDHYLWRALADGFGGSDRSILARLRRPTRLTRP